MNLNEVRSDIAVIKSMLTDMVAAEEIPESYALELAKVVVTQVLCKNSINVEYVPDP